MSSCHRIVLQYVLSFHVLATTDHLHSKKLSKKSSIKQEATKRLGRDQTQDNGL
jgi:hypothetical protein